jgi:hypothetical protein
MARNNHGINVLRLEAHPDCISSVLVPELIPELIAALLTPIRLGIQSAHVRP